MSNNIINYLDEIINNCEEIEISMSAGNNGILVYFVPDDYDCGSEKLTIYSGNDIYTMSLKNMEYDDLEDRYVSCSGNCSIIIRRRTGFGA